MFTLGGGGGTLTSGARPGTAAAKGSASASGLTDEVGEVVELRDLAREDGVSSSAHEWARRIAARLAVRRPKRNADARRGSGAPVSMRYRGGCDEIDMDCTLGALVANPVLDEDDIVVRDRLHTKRSVVLVVDISGSMKGERVRTAAATVGALAAEMARDDVAVIAFWSDAAVLARFGEPTRPLDVLDTILRIPARGLTNIHFALHTAAGLLRSTSNPDARVLLLSDCVHNAGPDPRTVAAAIPRLDVLLDTSGESDVELGRDLARAGHGRVRTVRGYREVAPALSVIFG